MIALDEFLLQTELSADVRAQPFVQWVGGKRQLLLQIKQRFPRHFGHYYEPFVGGGAVFFALADMGRLCQGATLLDQNDELINAYCVIRDNPAELIEELYKHRNGNNRNHFNAVRAWDRSVTFTTRSPAQRAARFIYLNRTCYNGLYRVNRRGQFNAPFGRNSNPRIYAPEFIHAVHAILKTYAHTIQTGDFDQIKQRVRPGDFIYFDPPYAPLPGQSESFTRYTRTRFDLEEQQRLADLFFDLSHRGCYVLLSNANTPDIRRMYHEAPVFETIEATRMVNSNAAGRGVVCEVLIRNYD